MENSNENSEELFERLMAERQSPKFRNTFQIIKETCDKIENLNGELTYGTVTDLANLGKNTIANDKEGHRKYLKLRQEEYALKSINKKNLLKKKKEEPEETVPRYPTSGLDQKTIEFIDMLHSKIYEVSQRNTLLEKSTKTIQQELLDATRANPLCLTEILKAGPDSEVSMKLISNGKTEPPLIHLTSHLSSALQNILNIPRKGCSSLYLDERNALVFESSSEKYVLLTPKEWSAIDAVMKKVQHGQ